MSATPWDALLHVRHQVAFERCQPEPSGQTVSKAGQIRELLRRNGPMSAGSICMDVDIMNSGLVSAVLKHDMALGRVRLVGHLYSLDPSFDDAQQREISQAVRLLKRAGYRVEKLA